MRKGKKNVRSVRKGDDRLEKKKGKEKEGQAKRESVRKE